MCYRVVSRRGNEWCLSTLRKYYANTSHSTYDAWDEIFAFVEGIVRKSGLAECGSWRHDGLPPPPVIFHEYSLVVFWAYGPRVRRVRPPRVQSLRVHIFQIALPAASGPVFCPHYCIRPECGWDSHAASVRVVFETSFPVVPLLFR